MWYMARSWIEERTDYSCIHVYLTWCLYFCQPIFALVYFPLSGFLLKICAIIHKGQKHIYQTDTKWGVNIGRQCPTRGRGQTWLRREKLRHLFWLSLPCPIKSGPNNIPKYWHVCKSDFTRSRFATSWLLSFYSRLWTHMSQVTNPNGSIFPGKVEKDISSCPILMNYHTFSLQCPPPRTWN